MSVTAFVDDIARHLRRAVALRALVIGLVALGAVAGGTAFFLSRWAAVAGALAAAAVAARITWARDARLHDRARLVRWLDDRTGFDNLLVTAHELETGALRAPAWVRERVEQAASQRIAVRRVPGEAPRARQWWLAAAALAAGGFALVWAPASMHDRTSSRVPAPEAPVSAARAPGRIHAVSMQVEPPPYLRAAVERHDRPARVDVIEGSRVTLDVTATGQVTLFESGPGTPDDRVRGLERVGPDRWRVEDRLVEPAVWTLLASSAGTDASHVVVLAVRPDGAPSVAIERPEGDLVVAKPAVTVPVEIVARDDHGLSDLHLRYTVIQGSGENFDFTEGRVPLATTRTGPVEWHGRATLDLHALGLRPGDAVVYRAVARDARRDASGTGWSDSYLVEVRDPASLAAAEMTVADPEARYAISQQMVLEKTRRLHAERTRLAAGTRRERAQALSAEQRMVRAEFVFMMGGDVHDEVEEAAHSHEIQEGRLENQGRRDLVRATTHMALAEKALTDADTGAAIPQMVKAVDALQRAFGRSRYILRAIPSRTRIDLSRRLTGELDEARSAALDNTRTDLDPSQPALRDVAAALGRARRETDDGRRRLAIEGAARLVARFASGDLSLIEKAAQLRAAAGAPLADVQKRIDELLAAVLQSSKGDVLSPARSTPTGASAADVSMGTAVRGRSRER